jgi:hypothetical protein
MLKVVEKIYESPIRMIAKPGVKFEPGQVGRIIELPNGTAICDISDGMSAIGIVGSRRFITGELSFLPEDMIRLWTQRMVFRTDRYDKRFKYETGAALYVNRFGLLSLEPAIEGAHYVARVITGPSRNHRHFEALWL